MKPTINYKSFSYLTIAISMLVWSFLLIRKFYQLGYDDWDLAMYVQAVYGMTQGRFYVPMIGLNFFGDHSNFISFLSVPLMKLFPTPFTLIFLKLILYHLTALSVFTIARYHLGGKLAAFLLGIFLLFPANIYVNIYDFNFDCFAFLLLIWLIFFYKERHFGLYVLTSILLILVKENMPLVLVMMGIAACFSKRKKKLRWIIFSIGLGLVTFILMVKFVIPYFRGVESHGFVARYTHLGGSVEEIIGSVIKRPLHILNMLVSEKHLPYLGNLFGVLLIPALLGISTLALSLPIMLQYLLSNNGPEHTIFFHYNYATVPFIIMASIYGLKFLKTKQSSKRVNLLVFILFVLNATFITEEHIATYKSNMSIMPTEYADTSWAMIEQIPDDATVVATFRYLAPLSIREKLFSFHRYYSKRSLADQAVANNTLYTGKPQLPERIDYALIDFHDAWLYWDLKRNNKFTVEQLEKFFKENKLHPISQKDHVFLFKRIDHEQPLDQTQ
jgi:uncharacterized membrane protein